MISTVDIMKLTLQKAMSEEGKIDAIYLSTSEANPILTVSKTKMEPAVASVVSAVMAKLGYMGTESLDKGELEVVYVKARNGYIFIRSINKDIIMTVSTRKDAPIGLLLFTVENIAERVNKVISTVEVKTSLTEESTQLAEIIK
jgi:predicted regulator of Ras-like GTPase activity (Roadblock/LC7/MglB family)